MPSLPPTSCIALIPARSGSKRVANKNTHLLGGHPILAYSIHAALESNVFSRVIVSTDSEDIARIARHYGAEVPFLRPAGYATDTSPDIEWIIHLLTELSQTGPLPDCFSILRPTSPFRQPETIQRAWLTFCRHPEADSLRAVEKCGQHPAKMWKLNANHTQMVPVMANPDPIATPWHSMPYQALPEIYVQNASLEIAWCRLPLEEGSIAGTSLLPFITQGHEGFDINTPEDIVVAEHLVATQPHLLPNIRIPV